MWVYDHIKKKIFLSRHNKKEITINEEYLLEQFKEEIAEELSIDKKKLNKEEEK